MNFSQRIYTPYNTFIYDFSVYIRIHGLNEWSKATFQWPLRPQKYKALHQHLTIVFVLLNSRVFRGGESVMVQQQPVVRQQGVQKQQHQEHQSLSMSRACKSTPLKVSRAEMMQEQKRHTHTLHAYEHAPTLCTREHTRTCEKVHACAFTHMYAHAHIHACMYGPQHARKFLRTCTHPRIHTTISKHMHTHVCAHASMHTHTHT